MFWRKARPDINTSRACRRCRERAPRSSFPNWTGSLWRCGQGQKSQRRFGCSGRCHEASGGRRRGPPRGTAPMKPRAVGSRWSTGDEWWRPMPPGASADALRILMARGVRAFGDGFVALLLPIYLVELGFSALAIGAIVTSTLIGTALLTLGIGWIANRYSRRGLLGASALVMAATGAGFALLTEFWPLLVIAFVGTMNPTSGDASIFAPLEQTVLTETVEARRRTALFARYSVMGSVAGALGVLAAGFPDVAAVWMG